MWRRIPYSGARNFSLQLDAGVEIRLEHLSVRLAPLLKISPASLASKS
jgi:hypothetical protein